MRLAVKVALGAVICAILGSVFHLPMGYLASLVVALVLVFFHGQTLRAGVPAILGMLVAGSVQVAITVLMPDVAVGYVLCSLLWLFVWMAFLPSLPLTHMLGGILIAMILFTVALGTAEIRGLLLAFWLQCSLGILVALGLDRLLWRSKREDAYFEAVASLLESFADDIGVFAGLREPDQVPQRARESEIGHIAHMAGLSGSEGLAGDPAARTSLNMVCRLIWERIQLGHAFVVKHGRESLAQDQQQHLDEIFTGLAAHYRAISQAALEQVPASEIDAETKAAIHKLSEALRRSATNPCSGSVAVDVEAPVIRLMLHALADHEQVVDAYNRVLAGSKRRHQQASTLRSILRGIIARPRPDAFHTAGRLTVTVLCLFVAVTYLGLPGSSLVAFYGVTFSLTTNIGQLHMKGLSGTLGVLGGIALGVAGVLIVTQAPHFPVLLGVFAIAMFLTSYAATAPEPIGYGGMQAALVTPYIFLTFEGPLWTVEGAATRALALVVSAGIAMAVQRLLWPQDPLLIFRSVMSNLLRDIAEVWKALGHPVPPASVQPRVVFRFDQGANLLRDARYVIGSRHALTSVHVEILRSLQDLLASARAMDQLVRLAQDDPLVTETVRRLTPELRIITQALEGLSNQVRGGGVEIGGIPAQLEVVNAAAERLREEIPPGAAAGSRRDLLVLSALLSEVTGSLAATLDATGRIPGVSPSAKQESSEGWRASARTNPSH